MTPCDEEIDSLAFYRDRYEVIAYFAYETGEKAVVRDPGDRRVCRFCNRDIAETPFRNESHAIPEFLGNRTVLCHNECDECNARLAREYEDHLAKWSHLIRSALKVRGKKKYPVFKSSSFRVEPEKDNLHIKYIDPDTPRLEASELPFDHQLYGDSHSQLYIPFRAAMSLTKMAVALCPSDYLPECSQAIALLNRPTMASVKGYLVGLAVTPGPVPSSASHAILIRRTTDDPIPYMWFMLQCRNFRLQSFVPLCKSDNTWMREGEASTIPFYAYPSLFDEQWPFGATEFGTMDWSSIKPERTEYKVLFRFTELRAVDELDRRP